MTTLIIARHGNTFGPGDTVTYVGARTDLPLAASGIEQAKTIGRYLKAHNLIPDVVYAGALKRAQETAKIAVRETGMTNPVYALDIFREIDYGPDENKTKDEVIARIGEKSLMDWDEKSIVPSGWDAKPKEIINNWKIFAESLLPPHPSSPSAQTPSPPWGEGWGEGEITLVVTSNGIARFAPHLTGGDYDGFLKNHSPKMATGALSIFKYENGRWNLKQWNMKP